MDSSQVRDEAFPSTSVQQRDICWKGMISSEALLKTRSCPCLII